MEVVLTPAEAVQKWVTFPEKAVRIKMVYPDVDSARPLAPIDVRWAPAPGSSGPGWSIVMFDGSTCARAETLTELMPWLKDFAREADGHLAIGREFGRMVTGDDEGTGPL